MKTTFLLPIALAASTLLAACGGGGGNDESPQPTSLTALAAVSSSTTASLNGNYSSSTVSLTGVEKIDPLSTSAVCSFRFAGVQQQGSARLMSGDIRYEPLNNNLRTTFIRIDGAEYLLSGSAGAAVDRSLNMVFYKDALFTGSSGTVGSLVLSASIPMRSPRPVDC
jgi:hypothetical protein